MAPASTRCCATAGFEIIGGTPLFRLARHDEARQKSFSRLGGAGVLTRPFAARPDWLRFGIPQGDDEFRAAGRGAALIIYSRRWPP